MAMTELFIPRSLIKHDNFDSYFVDEVSEWLLNNNIKSSNPYYHTETIGYFTKTLLTAMASFENDNDALLFKMRWL